MNGSTCSAAAMSASIWFKLAGPRHRDFNGDGKADIAGRHDGTGCG